MSRQSVTWPLHVESENKIRSSANRFAMAGKIKRQRATVRLVLDATFTKRPLAHGRNRFTVTLTRISAGSLDAHDSLPASMKAVADEVAAFLELDDRDPRIEWRYAQQKCRPKQWGVTITIEDLEDPDVSTSKTLDASGPVLAALPGGGEGRAATRRAVAPVGRPRRAPSTLLAGERELPFHRCYVALPWDAEGELTELNQLAGTREPPEKIQITAPHGASVYKGRGSALVALQRRTVYFTRTKREDLDGRPLWLFVADTEDRKDEQSNGR